LGWICSTAPVRSARSLGLTPAGGGIGGLSPDLHLHNGLAEFGHPRPDLPPQVHFVGALVDPLPSEEVPSWWADVERTDRPVVHVTQGTVADTDLGDLVLPTLHALADLDVLVVASVGKQTPENVPANARVAPFLPYDRLLPRLSVMVTNGGFGGVRQALSHGIPLVVAGATEDKPEVAARVARAGVGVNLRSLYRAQDAARNSADLIERLAEGILDPAGPARGRQ
jgi:UDP:flavonoid glycosyltransferase YjiC (YdhE family)